MGKKPRPWDKQGPVQAARDIGGCCVWVIAGVAGIVTTAAMVAARLKGIA